MGDEIADEQARVVLVEFENTMLLVTYNPQGGFTKESLGLREAWETKFKVYLASVSQQARAKAKPLIWGGDFNVNPMRSDWSERAFDKIRSKVKVGELPAGCREQDAKSYREMLQAMNGVNVAEHFGIAQKRTCYQNEWYFDKNYGQRLDHVVINREALSASAPQSQASMFYNSSEQAERALQIIAHFGSSLAVPDRKLHQNRHQKPESQ